MRECGERTVIVIPFFKLILLNFTKIGVGQQANRTSKSGLLFDPLEESLPPVNRKQNSRNLFPSFSFFIFSVSFLLDLCLHLYSSYICISYIFLCRIFQPPSGTHFFLSLSISLSLSLFLYLFLTPFVLFSPIFIILFSSYLSLSFLVLRFSTSFFLHCFFLNLLFSKCYGLHISFVFLKSWVPEGQIPSLGSPAGTFKASGGVIGSGSRRSAVQTGDRFQPH